MSKAIIFIYLSLSLGALGLGLALVWRIHRFERGPIKENLRHIPIQTLMDRLIVVLSAYLYHLISWRYINLLDRKAAFLGISVSGLKVYWGQLAFSLIAAVLILFWGFNFIAGLLLWLGVTALCFVLPLMYFNQQAAKRKQGFLDAFSFLLDLLALNLSAGVSLNQSLKLANTHSQSSFLHGNVQQLIQALEQGLAVEKAWKDFAQRCDHTEVDAFVFAILQAHRQGLALQQVLQQQARQIKLVIYTAAEKKALALPTKLIFPIVVFIFPITFIVIAFPLLYGMLEQSF